MDDINITREIHRIIDDKLEAGVTVVVDWVAREIINGKHEISGADAPFYRVCTFKEVCRLVKRAIGKFDAGDTTSEQLDLPGFKHLQKAYPIARGGSIELVPVTACSDDELLERAAQLEEMAKGCRAHAREIRQYTSARSVAA